MDRSTKHVLHVVVSLVALAFVISVSQTVQASGGKDSRPNIIFFLADDQRFDTMGCAGHPVIKTPTMDKLAKQGERFTNAFVTTSICAASRASILSGLFERTHLYTFGTPPMEREHTAITYPMLLRQAGYRTGFVGKFGVNVLQGETQKMFDVFVPLNRNPYFKKQKDGTLRHVSEIAGDHAVKFLRSCKKDQPFCLSVSFNAPHAEDSDKKNHYPWPKAMDGLYDDVTIAAPRLSDPAIFDSQPEFLRKSMNRDRYFWRWDTPEKYQKNVKAYFRMISGIDGVMGRVLAELDKLGMAENTVVIFAGDNGYYLANRGFAGKWSHYEDSLRVPMIIFDPRLPADKSGRTNDQMVLNIDIPASIVDYAGVKLPKLYQGKSLVSLVEGSESKNWRTDFFCEHLMNHKKIPRWEGVRDQRWVYARYFDQKPAFEFLHDLKTDPDQLKNFATNPQYAKQLQIMQQRCNELRDQYGGVFEPRKGSPKKKKKKN